MFKQFIILFIINFNITYCGVVGGAGSIYFTNNVHPQIRREISDIFYNITKIKKTTHDIIIDTFKIDKTVRNENNGITLAYAVTNYVYLDNEFTLAINPRVRKLLLTHELLHAAYNLHHGKCNILEVFLEDSIIKLPDDISYQNDLKNCLK
jgi:hypothetical protein